jgi:CheY-like chemotaxis protein
LQVAERGNYNLVLLDLHLPTIQGRDVAMALRGMEQYRNVPIVALTAYDQADIRRLSLQSGCNLYLTKPVDPQALIDVLSTYLPRPASA